MLPAHYIPCSQRPCRQHFLAAHKGVLQVVHALLYTAVQRERA